MYKRNKTIREYHTEYLYTYLYIILYMYIYTIRPTDGKKKTICNISIVWEKNLQTGGGCGGGTRCNSSCDAVSCILFLLYSIRWPHSRGMILRFALSAGPIVVCPCFSPQNTHTALVIFIDAMFINVIFFSFTLTYSPLCWLLTFRLSKSKIIFYLYYLYTQSKLNYRMEQLKNLYNFRLNNIACGYWN